MAALLAAEELRLFVDERIKKAAHVRELRDEVQKAPASHRKGMLEALRRRAMKLPHEDEFDREDRRDILSLLNKDLNAAAEAVVPHEEDEAVSPETPGLLYDAGEGDFTEAAANMVAPPADENSGA